MLPRRINIAALLTLLALYTPTYAGASNHGDSITDGHGRPIFIIANVEHTQPHIALKTLRAVFGMRKHIWHEDVGNDITVFVLNDASDVHKRFCSEILGILPYRLRKSWDRLIFSGTGRAPIVVKDLADMRLKVANTPGSIGYTTQEYIDDSVQTIKLH